MRANTIRSSLRSDVEIGLLQIGQDWMIASRHGAQAFRAISAQDGTVFNQPLTTVWSYIAVKYTALVSFFITGSLAITFSACSTSPSTAVRGGSSLMEQPSAVVQSVNAAYAHNATSGDVTGGDATGGGTLFVANGRASSVDIYEKNSPHHLLGQITSGIAGPNAMAVDTTGNLFVSNVDNQTVAVYPPGSMTPSRIYTRGLHQRLTNPLTVAVGQDGTMYLVNYTHIGMQSEVLVYPPNQMTPSKSIPINGGADGLALDPSKNLYVSYNSQAGGRVLKFAPGSKSGQDLGISVGFAGGLAFDKSLDLLVCDQTAPAIDVFPPGATQPSKVISQGFTDPYGIAFGRYFQRLYVADSAGNNVLIFSYPDGALVGQIHRTFTAFGIAVSPAAKIR